MASSIKTTLANLVSEFKRLGVFEAVDTNEPKSAPGKGATCAIFLASITPAANASGLRGASGVYTFTVRIYVDMLRVPVNSIDPDLAELLDKVLDALAGDFDLGATVRNIDFFGSEGAALKVEAGYVDVAGKMCRIADLHLPLIVNDTMSFG